MSSHRKPEEILKELEQLDQRLAKIQSFLRASKTGNIGDSLLTKANVETAIRLVEEVNPEEKNMLQALKSLIPLAEKKDREFKQESKTVPSGIPLESAVTVEHTAWTSKLKTRMSPHNVI